MPAKYGAAVELRHLRYFVAVAEEGSLTVAATRRLHTAQPSLSRQMRDLELDVGVKLLSRGVRGVTLTAAGRAFLDHARLVLLQVDAAKAAARRAAQPTKPTFALGFLTGHEMEWLPEAMSVLRTELPAIEVTISSGYSPELADDLVRGKLDLAFLRPEPRGDDLDYRRVMQEPLVAIMPSDHRLAEKDAVAPEDLVGETFIGISETAPLLRDTIDAYLKAAGVEVTPSHAVDHIAMAMSLIASRRAIAILPVFVRNFAPWSVTSRPLAGPTPTIDLSVGYSRSNTSPIFCVFPDPSRCPDRADPARVAGGSQDRQGSRDDMIPTVAAEPPPAKRATRQKEASMPPSTMW